MSRGKVIAAGVVLAVLALIVGGIWWSTQARVPEVTSAKVEKENLTQTVTASGQLEGDVKADVFPPSAQAALTIKSIQVADGQAVKAGQILATLDPDPLDAAVAQARSAYKQAQAGLVQARRSSPSSSQRSAANAAVSAANSAVSNAEESLELAEAQLHDAQRQLEVDEAAYNQAVASGNTAAAAQLEATVRQDRAQVNQLRSSIPQLESGLAQARSGLAQAKASRDALQSQSAQISAAQAGVDAAGEALSQAQKNRDKATLTAPIDGIVVFAGGGGGAGAAAAGGAAAALGGGGGGKPVVGATVSAASAPFTVFQLGTLNFDAQIDEADISNVGVGMKGKVTLDAFPGVTFDTTVVEVKTQAIQTSTGGTAFPVLLSLKETGKRLLVGMGGNADIEVSGIEGAVTVPVEALFDEAGGTYVYVIGNDNVVRRRAVKTGVMTDTRAQILSGVEPGQNVALGGLANLKDGTTVRVK